MGAAKSIHKPVNGAANFDRAAPIISGSGTVRILICALDYKQTANPLTCTIDAKNFKELASACGVTDVTAMYDEQCQAPLVEQQIRQVGGRCQPDDYFIFYYSGHGTNVADQSGDERDGQDEAFCFVDSNGQISLQSCMIDDDFARIMVESTNPDVRIIILTDCCHSGTIADLSWSDWTGRDALSITGCLDNQTSGDIGKGGIFTHSMLLAIDKLAQSGESDYSVGLLYNATLEEDDAVFNSAQEITMQCASGCSPDRVAWPLIPTRPYSAPLKQAQQSVGASLGGGGGGGGGGFGGGMGGMAGAAGALGGGMAGACGAAGLQQHLNNPAVQQQLQQLGVPQSVLMNVSNFSEVGVPTDLNRIAGPVCNACSVQ